MSSSFPPEDPGAAQILDAAVKCFCHGGIAGTTLTRIAREAGVSRSALTREYATKDELVREVVRERVLGFARASVCRCTNTNAADKLRCAAHCFAVAAAEQGLGDTYRLLVSAAETHPDLERLYETEVVERTTKAIRRIIDLGIQRGEFAPPDPQGVATTIAELLAHALPSASNDIAAASVQLADTMLRCVLTNGTKSATSNPGDPA